MSLKIDLNKPVGDFLSRTLVTIDENATASAAAQKMTEFRLGALLVTRRGEPVGMVTERDMINKVVAAGKNPATTKVSAIMSSPILTADYRTKVEDAIAEMVKHGVRRLGVVKEGKIVGVVSMRAVVSAGAGSQILLPELEAVKGVRCPYCLEEMKDLKELNRHIDMMHIGKGLLQGDTRQW